MWYFRGWTQWHSIAIVIAELGCSTNKLFATSAWAVLDPILAHWDQVYKHKRDEPAWDHVNTLIERARGMRQHNLVAKISSNEVPIHVPAAAQATNDPVLQTIMPDSQRAPLPQSGSVNGFADANANVQSLHDIHWNAQLLSNQPPVNTPIHTGCAPTMVGFEGDFGSFDGLDDIDFSAFDAVFGDITWENSSFSTDFSVEMLNS